MILPNNSDGSALPANAESVPFDVEPLSWVLGEIHAALILSGDTLKQALNEKGEQQQASLMHARAYLHQAHGAIQILGLEGVSLVSASVHTLLEQIGTNLVQFNQDLVQKIELSFRAIYEYLDELLAGAPQQALRLFPYYRQILESMGVERIHPVELFFAPMQPSSLPSFPAPESPPDFTVLRQRFERALLRWLKNAEPADAAIMTEVLGLICRSRETSSLQIFWWVMQGFAHAVATGQVKRDVLTKQLFGRINTRLRRLADDAPDVDPGMMREGLFYIAQATQPAALLRHIRAVFQVEEKVPADYEQQHYGLIDLEALRIARERLGHSKNLWTRIVHGEEGLVSLLEQDLDSLESACAKLNSPPLVALIQQLSRFARQVAQTQKDETACLEIATAMLVVEAALKDIRRLPAHFSTSAATMIERLQIAETGRMPLPVDVGLEENSRLAQFEATIVLAAEMQAGLTEAEKILDAYFRDQSTSASLANVSPLLHQIEGALAILQQDDAVLGLQHTQSVISRLLNGLIFPEEKLFEELAKNIGALGLFMDALRINPFETKQRFHFDKATQIFCVRPPAAPEEITSQAAELAMQQVGDLQISAPLFAIYKKECTELLELLEYDLASWRQAAERSVGTRTVHAIHSLAGSSATVGLVPLQEIAFAIESIFHHLVQEATTLTTAQFDLIARGYASLHTMLSQVDSGTMPFSDDDLIAALEQVLLAVGGAPAPLPSALPAADSMQSDQSDSEQSELAPASDLDRAMTVLDLEQALPQVQALPQAMLVDAFLTSRFEADVMALQDAPDPDLLPVFIEEARDLLPLIGRTLRDWRRHPEDTSLAPLLLRQAHTLKGSARMAGAMRLGQHMHHLETRIENCRQMQHLSGQIFNELLLHHDRSLQLFDALVNPPPTEPVAATASSSVTGKPSLQTRHPPLVPVPLAAPLVRVRADILDRLVNQAGEVSISRSRLENEVGNLRSSMVELSDNIQRLRKQLREVEIQTESHIGTQINGPHTQQFDPLEFDRYTRLHELTRMMAESVDDVGSVQQNLLGSLSNAASDLASQSRMTRDLQQDLMRVRMVQFGSVSDRLYRLVRETAKEQGKRVNLDIRGTGLEVDRSVLDRMVGSFEHLLRNAIVHGIETAALRQAGGKSESGDLVIEAHQDGNEIVLLFADDGGGLDLPTIRRRARKQGLLSADAVVNDADLTELIFHPGFSTLESVTEAAGRGIGMDVVRTETAALGGTVTIQTLAGKGTRVMIRLPLTLAVTQIVLLVNGGVTYALPSSMVEQVVQLKATAFAVAQQEAAVQWQGQRVPMISLASMLGQPQSQPVPAQQVTQTSWVIIVHNGQQRLALHVDEVVGNREVVVKHTGPQLGRLAGVAGAAVLGGGQIVIILNPLQLLGRVMAPVPENLPAAQVRQTLVMVVDDSLTVRRVTQRLLVREGYQVALAKDGVDALEQLQTVVPDIMLVDIEMPRVDGFELVRSVRADPRLAQVPIIIITSRTASKHRELAMTMGIQGYFGKPFQEGVLLEAITDLLKHEAVAE